MYRSVAMNQSFGFWATLKRTLFMASLYFRLVRNYNPDESVLVEFNKLFYLVNDPQSLSFPALVCPVLWKNKMVSRVVDLCDNGDYRQAAELVYGEIPRWLRYLDRETMFRDVEDILRQYHSPGEVA